MVSHLFIVRVTRDARRVVASARRIDEEACGEFAQPQQLLNFLLGQPHGHLRCAEPEGAAQRHDAVDTAPAPAHGLARPDR
jgi:hypothetical protein